MLRFISLPGSNVARHRRWVRKPCVSLLCWRVNVVRNGEWIAPLLPLLTTSNTHYTTPSYLRQCRIVSLHQRDMYFLLLIESGLDSRRESVCISRAVIITISISCLMHWIGISGGEGRSGEGHSTGTDEDNKDS